MWPDVSGVRPARRFFWKLFFFLSVKRFRAIASRHFRSTWTPCPVWVTSFLTTPWLKAADREHVGHDPTFSLFFFLIFAQTSVSGTVPKIKRKEKKRKSCRDRGLSSLRSGLFSCRSLPSSFLAKKKKIKHIPWKRNKWRVRLGSPDTNGTLDRKKRLFFTRRYNTPVAGGKKKKETR